MADLDRVKVLNASENLVEKATGFLVGQALLLDDVVEKLAPRHILHDQKQLTRRFDNLVQLHNIGVPDNLEDLDLPHDSCDVALVLDLVFFQYFDGHFLIGQNMGTDTHLTESTLADGLAYKVAQFALKKVDLPTR